MSRWNLSNLWPTGFSDCNQVQNSELLPWVLFTQILRICIQKHCILLSFCARSTSTWALVTCNSYFCQIQGHVVSIQMTAGSSQNRCVISRHICTSLSRYRFSKQLILKLWGPKPRPLFKTESLFTWMAMTVCLIILNNNLNLTNLHRAHSSIFFLFCVVAVIDELWRSWKF